jgi:hypothetical protein
VTKTDRLERLRRLARYLNDALHELETASSDPNAEPGGLSMDTRASCALLESLINATKARLDLVVLAIEENR